MINEYSQGIRSHYDFNDIQEEKKSYLNQPTIHRLFIRSG